MADTFKNRKLYICATPQMNDLNAAGFAGLTYVQVKGVGSIGQTGTSDNIVSYDEMDSDVLPKAKGISNAGDPQVEVSRKPDDPGQDIMRAAGITRLPYAIKILDDDAVSGYTATTYYNRALIGGPNKPNGRQENFSLEVFLLGCIQREITVDPAALSAPTVTQPVGMASTDVVPDVSSSATLIALPGIYTNEPVTRTYQWYRDTAGNGTFVAIGGATSITYDAVAGDLTHCLQVRETATNTAGNVTSNSMSTKATIA